MMSILLLITKEGHWVLWIINLGTIINLQRLHDQLRETVESNEVSLILYVKDSQLALN